MTLFRIFAGQGQTSWAARVFLGALAFTILAYGSNTEVPLYISAIVFASLAGLSAFRTAARTTLRGTYAGAVFLLGALLLYVLVQTVQIPGLVNEAWTSIDKLVGPVNGAISVAPGITYDSLPKLALPFLVFLSGLILFEGDAGALKLWRALAYFGAAYAVFAILQELLFPDRLVFAPKTFYVGYLTGSFVNRNTAGTFFGVALLLNIGLLFYELRMIRLSSLVTALISAEIHWRDKHGVVLIQATLCLIVTVALFLTQSRGAAGASFIGATVGIVLVMMRSVTADPPFAERRKWRRYAATAAAILVVVGLFALFAGRSAYRMQQQGTEDLRWCAFVSTYKAIKDHPWFGTGFATFVDVFPVYRNEQCVGVRNVWDHAHNFFLEGYLGLGAAFVVALLVVYGVLLGGCVKGLRTRRRLRFVPAMGLAALCLTTLHAIVDFSLQIPGFAVYFAAIMASTMSISLART